MVVWMSPFAREVMVEHCKLIYPNECCGFLVGRRYEAGWEVVRSISTSNINKERARDRFEISPKDYLQVEKEAKLDGLDIVGFFHSHPDMPPYPSGVDAQLAWGNFLTVIVGVFGGQKVRIRAHLFEDDRKVFREVPVYVVLQRDTSLILPIEVDPDHCLDVFDEVEPFVTIAVKEALQRCPSGTTLLVRFNYEPALKTLPKALESDKHVPLLLRWNEEGHWELFARTKLDK